jgi:hypothetical protein
MSPREYRSVFASAASWTENSGPLLNCALQMEAKAAATAVSALRLESASAVLLSFQPNASNPSHPTSTAPASAPRQNDFVPAGMLGIFNSMVYLAPSMKGASANL